MPKTFVIKNNEWATLHSDTFCITKAINNFDFDERLEQLVQLKHHIY